MYKSLWNAFWGEEVRKENCETCDHMRKVNPGKKKQKKEALKDHSNH